MRSRMMHQNLKDHLCKIYTRFNAVASNYTNHCQVSVRNLHCSQWGTRASRTSPIHVKDVPSSRLFFHDSDSFTCAYQRARQVCRHNL